MADDLDFSKPAPPAPVAARAEDVVRDAVQGTAQSTVYRPALALEFFRTSGTLEQKPAGKPIFVENEKAGGLFSKSARMYLLLEGEIGLMIKNKFFGVVKKLECDRMRGFRVELSDGVTSGSSRLPSTAIRKRSRSGPSSPCGKS